MSPASIQVDRFSHLLILLTTSSFYFPNVKALETKVVDESSNGNCPICVDSFQIGDQVPQPYPRLFKAFETWKESLFFSCCSLAAMPPTSTPATLPASRDGLQG